MNELIHIELNESKFAEDTLHFIINHVQNTYLESSLFLSILDPRMKYDNLINHIGYLKERLSKLQFIIDYDEVYFTNNIIGFNDNTLETANLLGDKMFSIENFSKEIFWANEKEEHNFQEISQFDSFDVKHVPKENLKKTIINIPFNEKAWISYYRKLLNVKFPEFSEVMTLKKTEINYKHFKDDFFIGIACNYNSCIKSFRSSEWTEPEYKLIIFKKLDKKSIRQIITFNKFFNPYFCPPTHSFSEYMYTKNTVRNSTNEFSLRYIVQREFLTNGDVRLSMSEEFGEHLKRHAYFYYDMLYHTTKNYIKFIEDSLSS